MAIVLPFKAVRPTPEKVEQVVSQSYNSYPTITARNAYMDTHPYSFLHIINPEYKHAAKGTLQERYQKVRSRYLEFKQQQILIQDTEPCYYAYRITSVTSSYSYFGIIALASTEAYEQNLIKKHEHTLEHRELAFTTYLEHVRFHAEPVLLTYPDHPELTTLLNTIAQYPSTYSYVTTEKHELWKINHPKYIQHIQDIFTTIDALYIADGHHRCASSARLAKKSTLSHMPSAHFFMSYLIPESELHLYEFNRMVTDLNGLSTQEFLTQLKRYFAVLPQANTIYKPQHEHEFSMYLEGTYYSLHLKTAPNPSSIDTQVLYDTILAPILGIKDPRKDQRISYLHGNQDPNKLKMNIDKGVFKVGFGVYPMTIHMLKSVADQAITMPPKSTYITPKLGSGLTIYEY